MNLVAFSYRMISLVVTRRSVEQVRATNLPEKNILIIGNSIFLQNENGVKNRMIIAFENHLPDWRAKSWIVDSRQPRHGFPDSKPRERD